MRHLQLIDKSEFYLGNQDSTVAFFTYWSSEIWHHTNLHY